MNEQNIDPQPNDQETSKTGNLNKTGLDEWNARLDNNLEPEKAADPFADENAGEYQRNIGHDSPEKSSES